MAVDGEEECDIGTKNGNLRNTTMKKENEENECATSQNKMNMKPYEGRIWMGS